MAKSLEIKIDTSEAMKKINALNAKADKLKATMAQVRRAADGTVKAMQDFTESCSKIKIKGVGGRAGKKSTR